MVTTPSWKEKLRCTSMTAYPHLLGQVLRRFWLVRKDLLRDGEKVWLNVYQLVHKSEL